MMSNIKFKDKKQENEFFKACIFGRRAEIYDFLGKNKDIKKQVIKILELHIKECRKIGYIDNDTIRKNQKKQVKKLADLLKYLKKRKAV